MEQQRFSKQVTETCRHKHAKAQLQGSSRGQTAIQNTEGSYSKEMVMCQRRQFLGKVRAEILLEDLVLLRALFEVDR